MDYYGDDSMNQFENRNHIPENVRSIHLIAICGTGMAALAGMLKASGFAVTGSDQHVYPPMSTFLADKGIDIFEGYRAENLNHRPDLVVVGNAVSRDNAEVAALLQGEYHYCSMPQAVNRFIAKDKKRLVVTGTHGKTTTASILAWILDRAGMDPAFFIGGILKNYDSNCRLGKGPYMVLEGDEYDTAFFDKGPKFLHYAPHKAILTSVEFDHADIFKDLNHIRQAFDDFLANTPKDASVYAFDHDPVIDGLVQNKSCRIARYGRQDKSLWRLGRVKVTPPWTMFDIRYGGDRFGEFKTSLMGEHNLTNILAVIAVCHDLGVERHIIAEAVETFEGVKRRQEVRGRKRNITVLDDFAHHPTAVRETIKAIGPFCEKGRLIAVFEPRTNSSMRRVFQTVYPQSFDGADLICIRKPPLLHKIPKNERFDSEKLVADLKSQGKAAYYFTDTKAIIDFLADEANGGDYILVMSNGGFDNIHERLLNRL
jgi:UDP-N-acetylmuramate: L-alanyl-gamma-D-glutamyl-meso-diaminopimelate ligase